jgi:hypothetical protein
MPSSEEVLPVLVIVVVALATLVSVWSAAGMPRLYEQIGKGGLDVPWFDDDTPDA